MAVLAARAEKARMEKLVAKEGGLELPEIVRRYAGGESLRSIAKVSGQKSQVTLYNWMLAGLGDEAYHDVVTQCLVTRIAEADEALERAKNKLQVAIATQRCRFTRMDFERRRPNLYGLKQLNVVATVNVDSELAGTMGELLNQVSGQKRNELALDVEDAVPA